jgi:hypothetical protein
MFFLSSGLLLFTSMLAAIVLATESNKIKK